jgi:hypothetical protein
MIAYPGTLGRLCLITALAAALALPLPAVAADPAGEPQAGPPALAAVKIAEPPAIDGRLNDPCWQQATHVEDFWREDVDAPEIERTEAWICYDARAIYVAFRCHDSKPGEIRGDQKKRQGSFWRDDSVEFWLDVQNLGDNFYSFRVNPAGTQYDRVPGGTSEKIEWKGDWRAAAAMDEGGWSAEMEVPFAILRYPEGQGTFRFDFGRRLAREEHRVLWPACFAKVFDMENCARWTGVETPPAPFRYVIMPYLLSVASEDGAERESLTGGLDFKGTLPNGAVTLATYNPDFRNIEDVVETIDFTFVERRLPEYRPFFQEGAGYGPPGILFYSRRIGELDWGAKSFGTVGSHRFGILNAHHGGGENHFALDYKHLFGTNGWLGFSGVDRSAPDDPDNRAYGLSTYWKRPFTGGERWVSADCYQTRTQGEGGDDGAVSIGTGVGRTQGLTWSANYQSIEDEFRADDGYAPETGVRRFGLDLYEHHSYDEGATQAKEWWFSADTTTGAAAGACGSAPATASEMASTWWTTTSAAAGTAGTCTGAARSTSSGASAMVSPIATSASSRPSIPVSAGRPS